MRTRMVRLFIPLTLLLSLTSLPAGADEPFAGVITASGNNTYSPYIGDGMPISASWQANDECSYDSVQHLEHHGYGVTPAGSFDDGGVWASAGTYGGVGSNGQFTGRIHMCGQLEQNGPMYCTMQGHSGLGWVDGDQGKSLRLFDLGWEVEGLITGFYQEYDAAGVAQDRWGAITIIEESASRLRQLAGPGGCSVTQANLWYITFTPLHEEP